MKKYVSWLEVEKFVDQVQEVYKDKKISGIYAIPRGGLVLGVILSHRLNVPLLAAASKGCMVVDDICDSGESLVHYRKNSSGEESLDYSIVTMYYKENKLGIVPDFWMSEKGKDWIVFPWEEKEPEGGLMSYV